MLTREATSRYEANLAPEGLGLVQELANTIGVGPRPDLLKSTDSAARWLASIDALPASVIDEASLERLRQLRTSIRGALGEPGEGPAHSIDLTLRVRLEHGQIAVLREGPDSLEAGIAAALLEGRATGTLSRLKLCAKPECEVVFFDQSKNGAGKWHSPTRCGNAARVRAHRDRMSVRPGSDENSTK